MDHEGGQRPLLCDLERVRHDIVAEHLDSPYQERLDRIEENLARARAEV